MHANNNERELAQHVGIRSKGYYRACPYGIDRCFTQGVRYDEVVSTGSCYIHISYLYTAVPYFKNI